MVCSKFSKFLVLIWQCSLACLPLSSFSWAHLLCVPLPPKTWQSGQGLAVSFLGSLTGFWFLGLLICTKMRAWSDGSHVRWQGIKNKFDDHMHCEVHMFSCSWWGGPGLWIASVSLRVGSVLALQVLVKAVKVLWECPDVTVRVWRDFHSSRVDILWNILCKTESSDKHF